MRDDVTGEYYLQKDFPNMTSAKLKGKSANVLVIMTKARKLKLRGESTPYVIKWANRLNELLKTTQTAGGMWDVEEETTRDDSAFTRPASLISQDSRASSGTMETHDEAGTDEEEEEDVEGYNDQDPDVVDGGESRDCQAGAHGATHHDTPYTPCYTTPHHFIPYHPISSHTTSFHPIPPHSVPFRPISPRTAIVRLPER